MPKHHIITNKRLLGKTTSTTPTQEYPQVATYPQKPQQPPKYQAKANPKQSTLQ